MAQTRASILIAQDDGDIALSPILVKEGYRVEQFGATRPFFAEYRRLAPTLILLDSALSSGNVFALCGRLREQSSVPILMLTADDEEMIERAYSVGATDVLTKPIRLPMLRRRIQLLIEAERQTTRAKGFEQRWQQAFERNRAIQLIINPKNGRIVDANPAACAFYGYPREEFRRKTLTDLEAAAARMDETSLFRFSHRLASGQTRDVKIFSSPLEYDGQPLIYLIVYDLSKPKKSENSESEQRVIAEALRNTAAALSSTLEQDEVLDRILEQLNLVVPSESANIMLIEAGTAKIARSRGYDKRGRQELIDETRLKVRETPVLNWMVENNRGLAIPNVETFTGWVASPATDKWLKSYVAAPIRIGNYVIGFLNIDSSTSGRFSASDAEHLQIFADQAAIAIRNARLFERVRRQAAEMERRVLQRTAELEFEQDQLRAIIDAMTEGVAYSEYVDGKVQMRYVNEALCQMTGYTAEEWNHNSISLFRGNEINGADFAQLLERIGETLRTDEHWVYETRVVRKDGSEFDAMTITTGIHSLGAPLRGAVTVIRDISKEKALQQQKERFVAYASHELRTPITNLKTRLYLLRRQPERLEEHLRVLENVTDRMKRLVEDLLDISRFERGVIKLELKDVVLQTLIGDMVAIQQPEAERKQLQLTCELADTPIHVRVDTDRLAQVITNLVTNAINYTPSGGRIDVRVTSDYDSDDKLALIEVQDTGIGISEDHLPHIFQPFYRVISQVEGTGLGLSITQEIVELHGGEIKVESSLGVGSTFRFWLPVIKTETEPAADGHAH